MDIRYSLDENGNKYLPITHKKAVKGVNLNILDNFSDDKGYIQAVDNADLETMEQFLKSGFYYAKDVINSPDPNDSNGYIIIIARSATYKQAIFLPFNKNRFYLRHQVGQDNGWTTWVEIKSNNSDTTPLYGTDGNISFIDNLDMDNMDKVNNTGFFYLNSPINSPDKTNDNGYLLIFSRGDSFKKAMFMPYNKNRIYTRNMMGSTGWGSWMQIGGKDNTDDKIMYALSQFVNEDGYIDRIDNVDLDTMDLIPNYTGNYYLGNINNGPNGERTGYLQLYARSLTYQKAVFSPYDKSDIYIRHKLGQNTGWSDWELVASASKIEELENRIKSLEDKLGL